MTREDRIFQIRAAQRMGAGQGQFNLSREDWVNIETRKEKEIGQISAGEILGGCHWGRA
jgi:hypothetical protein